MGLPASAYQQNELRALLDINQIEKTLAEKSFKHFLRQSWHVLEPSSGVWVEDRERMEPHWGYHLDAICEHMEAVHNGQIRNLLVNVPPRHTKSTAISVAYPVWAWISSAWMRFLTTSYADVLAVRDSLKSRRLIQSNWFQDRWGDKFWLTGDQNQKSRYENNKTGHRIASSVGGVGTGEGGDVILCDDPHKVLEAESEAAREGVLIWWDETMSSRLNDPKTGRKVIIMQRIHERDLSGHVLEQGGYEHLLLPLEYNPSRAKSTSIGWSDPRKEEGELLCPDRYGQKEVDELKSALGPYAAAGQLDQNPTPRKGGMFDISKMVILPQTPPGTWRRVRYWDKAGTDSKVAKGKGARTAGVLMAVMTSGPMKGSFFVLDSITGQWAAPDREAIIKQTAQTDGPEVEVWVEQEPGSGGKESAESTIRNLVGFTCKAEHPTGDKAVRAEPYSSQVSVGNVYLKAGSWNQDFIQEHKNFPVGARKDQVDASAGAFNKLAGANQRRVSW